MNTGQMLLVMLAIILFSTILIATYNNLFTVLFMAYEAMYQMQAYKIADRIFQEIDAMNISGVLTFTEIDSNYTFQDSVETINNVNYNIAATVSLCNQYGETAFPDSNYQRIDLRIFCVVGTDTLWTGTPANPVSYIYGNLGA